VSDPVSVSKSEPISVSVSGFGSDCESDCESDLVSPADSLLTPSDAATSRVPLLPADPFSQLAAQSVFLFPRLPRDMYFDEPPFDENPEGPVSPPYSVYSPPVSEVDQYDEESSLLDPVTDTASSIPPSQALDTPSIDAQCLVAETGSKWSADMRLGGTLAGPVTDLALQGLPPLDRLRPHAAPVLPSAHVAADDVTTFVTTDLAALTALPVPHLFGPALTRNRTHSPDSELTLLVHVLVTVLISILVLVHVLVTILIFILILVTVLVFDDYVIPTVLRMGVTWGPSPISLSQERQITELAIQYGVHTTHPVLTPMEPGLHLAPAEQPEPALPLRPLLGSIMWLMRCTRPDILFAVTYFSRFYTTFASVHYGALRRVLRYLHHTHSQPLTLPGLPTNGPLQVRIFTDSDWGAHENNRRSVSGDLVTVGSASVSWQSKRQTTVALSTCEAEYMEMGDGAKEGLCVLQFFSQFAEVQRPAPSFTTTRGPTT
jgi:hypothetical protein